MKFGLSHSPVSPVSPTTFLLCWGIVGVLIVMASLQLIAYEKFVPIIQNYHLFDNPSTSQIFSAFIIITEVMAMPFLLRMRVSPLLRSLSAGCLVLTVLWWLTLGIYGTFIDSSITKTGLLGGFLSSTSSFIVLAFAILLAVVSVMVIWRLRSDLENK